MMDALPPLVLVAREGDVRETKSEHLLPVIEGLCERIVIGLPGTCASLDDDAARTLVESLDRADYSLEKLKRADLYTDWLAVLRALATRDGVHGLVRGRCCRILFDKQKFDADELQRLALAPVLPAEQAAAWIEGVLRGSGRLLLNQDGLWQALDQWLSELGPESFVELLPLLRRAFSGFSSPEHRLMGEKVCSLSTVPGSGRSSTRRNEVDINYKHAGSVLPVLARILGVKSHAD